MSVKSMGVSVGKFSKSSQEVDETQNTLYIARKNCVSYWNFIIFIRISISFCQTGERLV